MSGAQSHAPHCCQRLAPRRARRAAVAAPRRPAARRSKELEPPLEVLKLLLGRHGARLRHGARERTLLSVLVRVL